MVRSNRVRVSDEELRLVREAKEAWYGEEVAGDIPDGKAIGRMMRFVINDQGPPPEEAEDG